MGGVYLLKLTFYQKNVLYVLNYHNFSKYNNYRIQRGKINETGYINQFEKQIKFLKKHFNFCYPDDFFTNQLSKKINILITFDDGYKDNYDLAFPILKRNNVKAIFFIATNYIGTKKWLWHDIVRYLVSLNKLEYTEAEFILKKMNQGFEVPKSFKEKVKKIMVEDPPERLMMNWKEVLELLKGGFIIGAHTSNHIILSFLEKSHQELEINNSIQAIKTRLGVNCLSFAYPNGIYNEVTLKLLKKYGINYAFTTNKGFNKNDQEKLKIKRIGINVSDSVYLVLLKLFISQFH